MKEVLRQWLVYEVNLLVNRFINNEQLTKKNEVEGYILFSPYFSQFPWFNNCYYALRKTSSASKHQYEEHVVDCGKWLPITWNWKVKIEFSF